MDLSSLFESLNCTATVVSKSNIGLSVINWVFLRIFVWVQGFDLQCVPMKIVCSLFCPK